MSYKRGKYYTYKSSDYIHISDMPLEEFDEIVLMRLGEIIREGKFGETLERLIEKESGNIGSWAIRSLVDGAEDYDQWIKDELNRWLKDMEE